MNDFVLPRLRALKFNPAALRSVWALIIAIPVLVLLSDPKHTVDILSFALNAFGGTLPYIMFAVILIAYLKASGAESVIARAFEGQENRMIILAALFGGLAPFCSCEVIPFIAGLLAVGAPLSAVMAFWLSSPLIDPPTLFITAAALGWEFAIGKAVAAVAIGLIGGFAVKAMLTNGTFANPLRPREKRSCCGCGPSPFSGKPVWQFWHESSRQEIFKSEALSNILFLGKWLMLAYLLEALLVTYVPAQIIGSVVGGSGLWPIVVGAVVGAPAYLNGYVAPALVAGLMEQGMSAGAAMAFMVSGAVSSIPAMAAVWSLVKHQVFIAYLGFGIGGAILIGIFFELLM